MLKSAGTTTFEYDYTGKRTKKNNIVYAYAGDRLIYEKSPNHTIYYFYDAKGISGFRYNNANYQYVKNALGDVVGIVQNGQLVAHYTYDAWGACTILKDSDIAQLNPIRYRGYYYDTETGLAMVGQRYYSPELGIFIQPGDISTLNPSSINGLNLYSYANNNPIGIAYSGSGGKAVSLFGNVYYIISHGMAETNGRVSLPAVPWLVENATTIYGAVSSLVAGIPILSQYSKYSSFIKVGVTLTGVSDWKTLLQLSNVSFKMSALDGALIGINVLVDMYDSYQRGVSTEGILLGGVLTAVSGIGLFYLNKGIMLGATAIGTAISPGTGTTIGFAVGLGISLFVDLKFGEWISDWIDSITS